MITNRNGLFREALKHVYQKMKKMISQLKMQFVVLI